MKPKPYEGVDEDMFGGMTANGRIVRDAWVFELIPETETCKGWLVQGIQDLHQKVNDEWDKYSSMVSQLPAELFERHQRIHGEAIKLAKQAGWTADVETEDAVARFDADFALMGMELARFIPTLASVIKSAQSSQSLVQP